MTNTNRKPTKRDHYNELLAIPAVAENEKLVAFIEHEIELLDKKNSAERKPTAKQTANMGIKDAIVEWMVDGEQYAVADIVKGCPTIVDGEISANRVTALMTQLTNEGRVTRTTEKRKNYYALA